MSENKPPEKKWFHSVPNILLGIVIFIWMSNLGYRWVLTIIGNSWFDFQASGIDKMDSEVLMWNQIYVLSFQALFAWLSVFLGRVLLDRNRFVSRKQNLYQWLIGISWCFRLYFLLGVGLTLLINGILVFIFPGSNIFLFMILISLLIYIGINRLWDHWGSTLREQNGPVWLSRSINGVILLLLISSGAALMLTASLERTVNRIEAFNHVQVLPTEWEVIYPTKELETTELKDSVSPESGWIELAELVSKNSKDQPQLSVSFNVFNPTAQVIEWDGIGFSIKVERETLGYRDWSGFWINPLQTKLIQIGKNLSLEEAKMWAKEEHINTQFLFSRFGKIYEISF